MQTSQIHAHAANTAPTGAFFQIGRLSRKSAHLARKEGRLGVGCGQLSTGSPPGPPAATCWRPHSPELCLCLAPSRLMDVWPGPWPLASAGRAAWRCPASSPWPVLEGCLAVPFRAAETGGRRWTCAGASSPPTAKATARAGCPPATRQTRCRYGRRLWVVLFIVLGGGGGHGRGQDLSFQ